MTRSWDPCDTTYTLPVIGSKFVIEAGMTPREDPSAKNATTERVASSSWLLRNWRLETIGTATDSEVPDSSQFCLTLRHRRS